MNMYPARKRNDHGFTLLEVMAALAITGIGVLVVLQLFSGGLASAKASEDYSVAVLHAREKLSEVSLKDELVPGVKSGDTVDGYRWTVEVAEYESEYFKDSPDIGIYKIIVKVRNPEGKKEFKLETLKTLQKKEARLFDSTAEK